MLSPKFKVGDTVVCVDRPFELLEIIKQIPGSGKRQYRIGPPPIRRRDGEIVKTSEERGEQREVGETKLKGLEKVLDELLNIVKAKKDGARDALLIALSLGRHAYDERTKKPLPVGPVKRLKEDIQNTIHSFAELTTKYGFPSEVPCEIGGGIVSTSPIPIEMPISFQVWDSESMARHNEGTAIVNIPNLLKAWLNSIEKLQTKKKEGQPKPYKGAICEEAIWFLDKYCADTIRADAEVFVEKFYGRVTGLRTDEGSLEYQIKKARKRIREAMAKNVRQTGD
jgi:hypothetical protein